MAANRQPPVGTPAPARMATDKVPLMEVDIGNFKSALNETVMKVIQRPLRAEDIVYSTLLVTMAGGMPQYHSTVRINALEGREFEGAPQSLRKSAEQGAAQVALTQIGDKLAGSESMGVPILRSEQVGKLPNYKGRLQELLVQESTKARLFGTSAGEYGPVEISYSTSSVPHEGARPSPSKFLAKVQVTTTNYQVDFQGEVCKERKTAEQSAAYTALQHYLKQEGINANSLDIGLNTAVERAIPSAKSELNELVMKILARPATGQDIVYGLKGPESSPFTAFVAVPSLAPGKEFEGEAHPQKKAAEQSAANEALKHFKSLPRVPTPVPGATAAASWTPLGGSEGLPVSGAALLARRKPGTAKDIEAKNGNHKSVLNEFVMKLVGRPLSSGDIVYTTRSNRPGAFQATAKIPVIDEMEFQAAPRQRKRDAEQCAAQIALLYYQAKYPTGAGLGPDGQPKPAGALDGESQGANFKSALNELAMKTAGRPIANGDMNYTIATVGVGKFQATLKPTVIDANLEFVGEPRLCKKEAEQQAAAKALEYMGSSLPKGPDQAPIGTLASDIAAGLNKGGKTGDIGNFKSALNEFVMRSCGRPLAMNDITYISRPCNNAFLTGVKVLPLDPEREFDGEPRARKKEAQQLAAKAALLHFQGLTAAAADAAK